MKKLIALLLLLCVFCVPASAEIYNIHWCSFFAMSDWHVITEENKWMWDKETQIAFNDLYVDALAFFEDPTYGLLEIRIDLMYDYQSTDFSFNELDDNYLFYVMYQAYESIPDEYVNLSGAKVKTIGSNKWFVLPGGADARTLTTYQTCYKGQMITISAVYRSVSDVQPLTPLTELFIEYVDFTNKTNSNYTDIVVY